MFNYCQALCALDCPCVRRGFEASATFPASWVMEAGSRQALVGIKLCRCISGAFKILALTSIKIKIKNRNIYAKYNFLALRHFNLNMVIN